MTGLLNTTRPPDTLAVTLPDVAFNQEFAPKAHVVSVIQSTAWHAGG